MMKGHYQIKDWRDSCIVETGETVNFLVSLLTQSSKYSDFSKFLFCMYTFYISMKCYYAFESFTELMVLM